MKKPAFPDDPLSSLLWDHRKYGLCPGSWHRPPESLIISWAIGVSFLLMGWLWVGSWMAFGWGRVTKKSKLGIFSPAFQFFWEGQRTGNGVNDRSCLLHGVQGASGLVNTFTVLGEDTSVLGTLPDLALCVSSSGCHLCPHPLSYPSTNWQTEASVSLSSVSCSGKLIWPRGGGHRNFHFVAKSNKSCG